MFGMGDMPRDESGLRPCEWCGGPIQQPPAGRRRRYCSRTHRELAYRERKTQRRVDQAVTAAVEARDSESTVDETGPCHEDPGDCDYDCPRFVESSKWR